MCHICIISNSEATGRMLEETPNQCRIAVAWSANGADE
jgi:hypothetical protein